LLLECLYIRNTNATRHVGFAGVGSTLAATWRLELELKRRDFLKWGFASAVFVSTAARAQEKSQAGACAKPPEYQSGPSIMQGATDATHTQFSILFDANRELDIFAIDPAGIRYPADEVRPISYLNHPKKITKVFFSGLDPHQTYALNLVDPVSGEIIDARTFKTLDLTKPSLQFALCSCMDEALHDPTIWRDMVDRSPDMLFFIGDSVYADTGAGKGGANPDHLWKRFCEARMTLEIYFSKRLIPIIATWDDHDFGLDDSNCHNYPYVQASQKNFLNFFAQEESHCSLLKAGPGVSSAFRYQEQLFLFLDARSFREASGSNDPSAHWGPAQEVWMMDLIAQQTGPTWLMSGTQIFPEFLWKDSVSKNHPAQFASLLKQLKKMSSKVIFASGDVHFSEISEIETEAIGYKTYELTSSGIHSLNTMGAPFTIPNKRRIAAIGARNYILVDSAAKGFGCAITATSYGTKGQMHFTKKLEV
jgi:alkaline phosphatase D